MRISVPALLLAALVGIAPVAARAEVTRFDPDGPASPAFGGRSFGEVGAYVRQAGRATIALDPAHPANAGIIDLGLAPRNAAGRVEAVADVVILRPADPARGSGTLLLEVPNRGRELAGGLLNDTPAANTLVAGTDPGNGHLMAQGATLVWVGWQADLSPRDGLRMVAPVIAGIEGPSREEFQFDHARNPVTVPLTYPAATAEGARLVVRRNAEAPRETPADLGFRFLDPQRIEITRPAGHDAGALYELTYTAKDPTVQGMAFAALRDVAAHLRQDAQLAPGIRRTILFGISQSGRVARDFLYQGFNQDEAGRQVFDGVMAHIPATRRSFTNARFAQPGRNPRPDADRHYPADQFPFAYEASTDHLTGRRDGLLDRCRATRTCPRIIQTDTEYELWGSRASLLVTDTRGAPLDLPPEVRAYLMVGHPHFNPAQAMTAPIDRCVLPSNPLQAGAPMRALYAAMEAWLRERAEPPASRYPTPAAGTLVPAAGLYEGLPMLGYRGAVGPALLVDAAVMPPEVLGAYTVLVPKVDADGHAVAGIRLPVIDAPRATYTGWNMRAEGFAPGQLCYHIGSVVPFAPTRAARLAAGDPRPSIEERYPTAADYVAAVRRSADALVADRLLLPADAAAMVAAAEAGTLARLR